MHYIIPGETFSVTLSLETEQRRSSANNVKANSKLSLATVWSSASQDEVLNRVASHGVSDTFVGAPIERRAN